MRHEMGLAITLLNILGYPVKISVGVVLSRFEGNPLSSQLLKLWSTANGTLRAYLVDYGKSNGDAHRKPLSF